MSLLITTIKQESKPAAVEVDQSANITTQLVQQKSKWAPIENGDHDASITTDIEKKKESNVNIPQR